MTKPIADWLPDDWDPTIVMPTFADMRGSAKPPSLGDDALARHEPHVEPGKQLPRQLRRLDPRRFMGPRFD